MAIYKVSVWSQLFYQPPVEDKDLTTPPGAPTKGDRYIVGAGASGAWAGQDDKVTTYDGAAWGFVDPKEGMLLYIKDEDKYYIYVTSWSALSTLAADHAASHKNGGGDEVSVAGLSGELADNQPPKTHKASHENAGGDEINVAGLSGLLADDQHVLDAEVLTAAKTVKLDDFSAPDDNADLNASITKHGLLKKLSNNALQFLNGVGNWITGLTNLVEDTTPQLGGTLDCQNKDLDNIKTGTFNGEYDAGNSGAAAKAIDFNNGQNQKVTLNGNCTFAFTAPPGPAHCQLKMIQDGTGSRDPSWPAANFTWIGGTEPTWATGAGQVSIVNLWWDGTDWWAAGMKFA